MCTGLHLGDAFEIDVWGMAGRELNEKLPVINIFYNIALSRAMNNQGDWDPANPSTEIGKLLIEAVKARLTKKGIPEQRIKLFRTVGTYADCPHGVDGVMTINDFWVSIDTTANPNKVDYKADIIFYKEDAVPDRIHRVARAIVNKYIDQQGHSDALDELFS